MNGIKYLLDTNFILGLLKSSPEVMALVTQRNLLTSECAYSSITRMELLGFPDLSEPEQQFHHSNWIGTPNPPIKVYHR